MTGEKNTNDTVDAGGAAVPADPAPAVQDTATPTADLTHLKRVVEALLFGSDRPVSASRLAELAEAPDGNVVRRLVRELQGEYEEQQRAFRIEEIAGGFQLLSRPEFAPWVGRLHARQQQESLSKAALETLAIVAYRQPITRAQIEDIRGVQCGPILRALVEKRLVKVVGKSDELGHPLLYGTTKQFLSAFGLKSLKDLPKRHAFDSAQPRLKRVEPAPAEAGEAEAADASAEAGAGSDEAPSGPE